MTASQDKSAEPASKQNGVTKHQGATYTVQSDKRGHTYHHPQQGGVKVVALFCDCGRSILVRPVEAKRASIICRLCNTPFCWQQLTFVTD
jgi:hypothetical protein